MFGLKHDEDIAFLPWKKMVGRTFNLNKVRHGKEGDEESYNLMDIFNELEGNRKR